MTTRDSGPSAPQLASETPDFGGPPPVINDKSIERTQAQNDIFFAAVETTRMPMVVADPRRPDCPIVFCNPAFVHLTGYRLDEIEGRNCRFLQGPDTDPNAVREVARAIRGEKEVALEILNYRKDGSTFWNALFISPVYDASGALTYFFASQLDVSRRRDAEEALRQAQKMEALGQLTGGIAHDFNNLLQVIIGYVDGLKAKADETTPPFFARAVDAIGQAADRGATLTQQLLAFARKQRLDGRTVNFNGLLEGLSPLIERTVGGTIKVEQNLHLLLPNAKVDTTQAELAILNILINARDALEGSKDARIVIATDARTIGEEDISLFGEVAPGDYVVVSITDNGCGMSPDVLRRVLEPFFTTKDQGKGTGLGLSMVYGFVKQSGGALKLYSEVGEGTTVRLFFPAQVREEPIFKPQGARAPEGGVAGETVLLVEDQGDVGDLAEAVLTDFGYRVLRAGDGREALAILESPASIDLLFTDLIMPGGINGVMLAREARTSRPRLKVLLTTGYADLTLDRDSAEGSEFEIIKKPYRRSELATRVRQVIDGSTGVA